MDTPGEHPAGPDAVNAHAGASLEALGGAVTITARSLFLTRDLRVSIEREPVWSPEHGRTLVPDWRHDSYIDGFALDAACIAAWVARGARVLDLASGFSPFGCEASALGLSVDCIDGELAADHPAFARARPIVAARYPAEMRRLVALATDARAGRGDARYAMDDAEHALATALADAAESIARRYPAPSGTRALGDARSLAGVPSQSYDVVLSGWLFVHLDQPGERAALETAVRVTRPGGEVRIKAGYGADLVACARRWFGQDLGAAELSIGGRRARVCARSVGDRLLLAVES